MQTLDVISVNLWQILISLLNLVLLFLIVKLFLYKPVKKIMAKRESELEERYTEAENSVKEAEESKTVWESKLAGANEEANSIIQSATELAKSRGEAIVSEARVKADGIIRVAQTEAELERVKAADGIKREIVEVSGAIAEKLLEREINADDHRGLIDSFIDSVGDENE